MFDAFARSGNAPAPLAHAPKGVVFATTNKLPPPLQHFSADGDMSAAAEPPRIMFPPDGARLELAKGATPGAGRAQDQPAAPRRSPSWSMACRLPPQGGRRTVFFAPDGPGFVRLTVMDARGATDSVSVRLQ